MQKNYRGLLLSLLLPGLILLLSSCGNQAQSTPAAAAPTATSTPALAKKVVPAPDQIQIKITQAGSNAFRPMLLLADKAQVLKFYALIKTLPVMPVGRTLCVRTTGPSYRLVFQQGATKVTTLKSRSLWLQTRHR
ncbi:hypothetical protein KDW_59480 [Dictyobacter vulcani]|uniref:Cyclophilin-like domain-containing protein n=1 Tax=Dictyobacter vulcani TaxID=2607529 RepID=A0A5J4L2U1_9CHLR|nr:hypothetical protein [Dictyobacter vulcani]GER91786.1 hypothetical protein KDW_59480 [Dictyobacter vulcani]